jgi:hypothetical protein
MEAEAAKDDKAAKAFDDRLGFLTPILKGFLTERGIEAASLGMQVYGGHGYIMENKQEQIARDVRIAALWEGTTGIQALDLLGRKIMMQKLGPINQHCARLRGDAIAAIRDGASTAVKRHGLSLLWHALSWQVATYRIAALAAVNKDYIGVASYDYLMYAGYVTMGAHWLKMEQAAAAAAAGGKGPLPKEFYAAKQATAAFYFDHLLPRTGAHMAAMFTPLASVMGLSEKHFSHDHALH